MAARSAPIWTPTFALLCLTQLSGYAHQALLTPTIPLHVAHLGGSAFLVGVVLAAFAVSSVLMRPAAGYWADVRGETGVLAWGCFLMGASLLLFFIPLAEVAAIANALRGVGWAGLNTGGYALLAVVAPAERRAEASGYYSGVQASVSILFPALGLWLANAARGGFALVIVVSGALAAVGGAVGIFLERRAPSGGRSEIPLPTRAWASPFAAIEKDLLLPAAFLFCINVTHPAATAFVVLYARAIGLEGIAWYYVASGLTSLLARPALGRVADRIGWGPSLATGFSLQIAGLLALAAASTLPEVLLGGVLYAGGNAVGTATTLALAIQRAHPQRRGRAMASFSVAYPLSAGAGALFFGSGVELLGYSRTYVGAAALAAAGLLVAVWSRPRLGGG